MDILKPHDQLINTKRLEKNFVITIENREDISKFRPKPREDHTINCFTDGSKTENRAGAAFIYMSKTYKKQESTCLGDATVFQAEIIAICNACRGMIRNNFTNQSIN